jgi:hypothetical protein
VFWGGAQKEEVKRAIVTDCRFERCKATGKGGGGIRMHESYLELRNSRFVECEGWRGGGVFNELSNIYIYASLFYKSV